MGSFHQRMTVSLRDTPPETGRSGETLHVIAPIPMVRRWHLRGRLHLLLSSFSGPGAGQRHCGGTVGQSVREGAGVPQGKSRNSLAGARAFHPKRGLMITGAWFKPKPTNRTDRSSNSLPSRTFLCHTSRTVSLMVGHRRPLHRGLLVRTERRFPQEGPSRSRTRGRMAGLRAGGHGVSDRGLLWMTAGGAKNGAGHRAVLGQELWRFGARWEQAITCI